MNRAFKWARKRQAGWYRRSLSKLLSLHLQRQELFLFPVSAPKRKLTEKVQHANDFLTLAGMIERTCYPVSCKYYHQLVGVPMSTYCRSADPHRLDNAAKEEVEALIRMENHIREELGIG